MSPDRPTARTPEWNAYFDAVREWERRLDETREAHCRMEVAAEKLRRVGEMTCDRR